VEGLKLVASKVTTTCPGCGVTAHFHLVADLPIYGNGRAPIVAQASDPKDALDHNDRKGGTGLLMCTRCTTGVVITYDTSLQIISSYPKRRERWDHHASPENVARAFNEVHAAAAEGAWNLAGVGCRITLDRVLKHQGVEIKGAGLKDALRTLEKKHPGLAPILGLADSIRLLGNAGAHDEDFDLSQADAEAGVTFVQQVLVNVYVLPNAVKELKKRLPNAGDALPEK
jgi:hypothetical protein